MRMGHLSAANVSNQLMQQRLSMCHTIRRNHSEAETSAKPQTLKLYQERKVSIDIEATVLQCSF